jgi:thiosulfate sulfurtransferase
MFKRVSCVEAAQMINEGACIVDIRDAASFAAGHAPNAIHLTNQNAQQFIQATDLDAAVLVMCYHGHSSQGAAQFLVNQGFTNVSSVDGGFEMWKLNQAVER